MIYKDSHCYNLDNTFDVHSNYLAELGWYTLIQKYPNIWWYING